MSHFNIEAPLVCVAAVLSVGTANATPIAVATYDFSGNSLAASEIGAPSLTAIDPASANAFVTDSVFGTTKTVYQFDGTSVSGNQGGLALNTTGLLSSSAYSVDIVFSFDSNGPSWERILDASNRSSDNGFYVEPGGKLQIYPVGNGPDFWTFGDYHRVTMTNDGAGHVSAYLDGNFQFDLITTVMDFATYAANPNDLLTFFSDNTSGPAQTEWVPGKVSLIRLYDIELNSGDVGDIGGGGGNNGSIPEPASLALLSVGLGALGFRNRKRKHSA